MSSKNVDYKNIKKDPHVYANAIDELGYKNIEFLNYIGNYPSVAIVQHLNHIPTNKQHEVFF